MLLLFWSICPKYQILFADKLNLLSLGPIHPVFIKRNRVTNIVGDFWRLPVKWHRTRHKTYKRQTHSGQRKNSNCTSKQARGLFLYISPGQNSILYDQTCSVQRMCINVIVQQKGVKFRLTAESVQSPYHKKGMFPYLQGTINLKAVSVSLAKHPVCKQHISTFPTVAALTLQYAINNK